MTFLIQTLVALTAGLVRGFSGFGAALVMAPGFTLVTDPRDAVAMTILLNVSTSAQLLLPALRATRWRDVGPMSAAAVLAIPFGAWILVTLDGTVIRRAIGALVLGFSVVLLAGWRYRGARTQPANLLVGGLGGLLTGATGFGGPPLILYFLAGDRPMAENRAGFISFFAITQLVTVPLFVWQGLVTWALIWSTALLVPIYLIATHVGAKLFTHASERVVRLIALGFLVLIGVVTLVR
ncbi:MAG: sulfite exporter TauE/SafE family protein [Proteobacteria bacterium]|nr:sulfite exporter TauE/SafE family protein [Pseudomonadota bacterium]